MFKRMTKKCLSLLLALCIVMSLVTVGVVSATAEEAPPLPKGKKAAEDLAPTGNMITETLKEQMIDDALRLVCMGLDWTGEATGNEDIQEAFSLIEKWAFMSTEEVAIEELKELCEEILNRLDEIETELNDSFSLLNTVLAEQDVKSARAELENKWDADVDSELGKYGAKSALYEYKQYLQAALDGSPRSDSLYKSLLYGYALMYDSHINLADYNIDGLENLLFNDVNMNSNFIRTLVNLGSHLKYDSTMSASLALYASQFAYQKFPFSHQQYQYVHAVIEKQLLTILLVAMTYNEYLYHQGEYIKRTYNDEDAENGYYAGYLDCQHVFYETMGAICNNIEWMLDNKMEVDGLGKVKLSLSDYMKPEDAVTVPMTINGYVKSLDFSDEVKDNGIPKGRLHNDDVVYSNAEYIGSTVKFNKVMTHTASGSHVYYILDPNQFEDPLAAMAIGNLDHNVELDADSDIHTQTCDYINLTKDMSDGVNTFRLIDDLNMTPFHPLFDTNFFQLAGSTVQSYLNGSVEYLPHLKSGSEDGFTKVWFLTPYYQRTHWAPAVTAYTQYKVLDGSKQFTGAASTIGIKEGWDDDVLYTGSDDFKSHKSAYGYSVLLSNTDASYKKKLAATVNNLDTAEIKICDANGTELIGTDGNTQIEAGSAIIIKMKFAAGYQPGELKLTRRNDTAVTETVLQKEDFEKLEKDGDWYTLRYTMPYSDSLFTLINHGETEYFTARIGTVENGSGAIKGYDPDTLEDKWVPEFQVRMNSSFNMYVKIEKGYTFEGLAVYNDDTGEKLTNLDIRSKGSNTDGNYTVYNYEFWSMPGCNIRIDAASSVSNLTAAYGKHDHCQSASLGWVEGDELRLDKVHDSHTMSMGFTNAIQNLCVIFTPESGYAPGHGKTLGIVTVRNAQTKIAYIITDAKMLTDTDDQGNITYYFMFPVPEPVDLQIDVTCEDAVHVYADTEKFVYDANQNPVCRVGLTLVYVDPLLAESSVWIPSFLNNFTGSVVVDDSHYLSHFKMVGIDTGTVYYEGDIPEKSTKLELKLNDNLGDLTFNATNFGYKFDVYFHGDNYSVTVPIPEGMVLIPTFTEKQQPTDPPTDPPTDAPTDPPTDPPTVAPTDPPTDPPTVAPTDPPTNPPTDAPTDAPTEPPTDAPTDPPTDPPTEKPTDPSEPEHGIRTYDELVAFAAKVNGGAYDADAYLEKNIVAPEDAIWPQGIGTEAHPYTGTFDGKGYVIIGLTIDTDKNGGLFDSIGEGGVVKDLHLLDVTFKKRAQNAGGIAAINSGTIDHCTSGLNLSGRTKITLPSGKKITPADYNSYIDGEKSGGIAGVNKGVITGSRSGAAAYGVTCGGIAGENEGRIYGCANNGAIGSTSVSCTTSGGIAGVNSGSIESSYNSGKVNCGSPNHQGLIAGDSGSADVHSVFYNNVNNIQAVGPESVAIDKSNMLVENSDMLEPAFVNMLNEVTDDTITWRQTVFGNTYFNQGYPTIEGRYLYQRTQNLMNNITVSGVMHRSMCLSSTALSADSDEYKALAEQGKIIDAYSFVTTDESGGYVPSELWSAGSFRLSIPVNGNDIILIIENTDGEITTIDPDRVENGVAEFSVADVSCFAVAKAPDLLGDADGDGSVTILDATAIQRRLAGLQVDGFNEKAADADGDGNVTIIDATFIQRWLADIPSNDNIGQPIV